MTALILSLNDKKRLDAGFAAAFDTAAERYFSAPGRTEVSGIVEGRGASKPQVGMMMTHLGGKTNA